MTEVDTARMTAWVAPRYGGGEVLRTEVVPRPVPGERDVIVRVRAASLCSGDLHLLNGTPYLLRLGFGLRRPKHRMIGQNLAGEVVAVGIKVSEFQLGDRVFGEVPSGAFAEFVRADVQSFALVPDDMEMETAAAIPDSGMTALQGLRDIGKVGPGHRVLINGASGGVGTFAVQIAKALGAHVTAVCGTRHLDMVHDIGADIVIDYTTTDFITTGDTYDVIFDLAGNRKLRDCRRALTPNGTFISSAGAPGGNWFGPIRWLGSVLITNLFTRQTLKPLLMRPTTTDLRYLAELATTGALRPVIQRRLPLSEAAAAISLFAEGHASGKTLLTGWPAR
ncbi:NAD(P)-dependent alcohol dehydrogenase [Nocardia caishijiensis]|uniref:NADPH:quinone reductase-like Zn-dependent oxidoreductase n=1 Tax=Nocardia caishijiensis TaxID=184756 RepID=A0ABQ6YTQ7_9NOCA|nr:NAD(P)-dependent alcohol dehydrogenase [Nocardia caishijiensis]KAF0848806.1 NADPH:quinone reductase-like Zn-dependent oxidoreductase [Nocardia caishijiensis]